MLLQYKQKIELVAIPAGGGWEGATGTTGGSGAGGGGGGGEATGGGGRALANGMERGEGKLQDNLYPKILVEICKTCN